MPARLLRFICMVCLIVGTTGCGFAVLYADECRNEAPTPAARNFMPQRHDRMARPPWPPKSVFLEAWGRPDRIERTSEECEIWVYDKKLWCGVIPIFLLPVPLVLPVCDGFDRIEFRGDSARVLHTRRSLLAGFAGVPGGGGGGTDPACRNPIPIPLRERIQSGRSLSLSVSIDTPEHREVEDYQEIADLILDGLRPALAQSGIFTEVVAAPESADYRLEVVVTNAQIRRKWFSFVPDNRVALQVQLTFRETGERIGEFEIDQQSESWRKGLGLVVGRSVEEIVWVLKDE